MLENRLLQLFLALASLLVAGLVLALFFLGILYGFLSTIWILVALAIAVLLVMAILLCCKCDEQKFAGMGKCCRINCCKLFSAITIILAVVFLVFVYLVSVIVIEYTIVAAILLFIGAFLLTYMLLNFIFFIICIVNRKSEHYNAEE